MSPATLPHDQLSPRRGNVCTPFQWPSVGTSGKVKRGDSSSTASEGSPWHRTTRRSIVAAAWCANGTCVHIQARVYRGTPMLSRDEYRRQMSAHLTSELPRYTVRLRQLLTHHHRRYTQARLYRDTSFLSRHEMKVKLCIYPKKSTSAVALGYTILCSGNPPPYHSSVIISRHTLF